MLRYYAECHILFTIMLNVVMLNVVMLSATMLNVAKLSVVELYKSEMVKKKKFYKIDPRLAHDGSVSCSEFLC